MASQFWSWIFIIQTLLIRSGYAHVSSYEVLTKRALENVFIRGLSKEEKNRNIFMALAIAGGVVLVAGSICLFIIYRRQRQKVPDSESGAVDKPRWFMVDGKNEKMDWWRLSHKLQEQKANAELPEGSRIERLKAALNKKAGKNQPQIPMHNGHGALPMQTDPDANPRYPDVLERGYRAPLYPVQSPPQVPSLTRTVYEGDQPGQPRSPPRAIVTQGLTRNVSRADRRGLPRSPAGRRKSWMSKGSPFRNPFLPLKDSDAPLPQSSTPSPPESSVIPPVTTKGGIRGVPAPLQLAPPGSAGLGSGRQARGLPNSPRPRRNQSPAV